MIKIAPLAIAAITIGSLTIAGIGYTVTTNLSTPIAVPLISPSNLSASPAASPAPTPASTTLLEKIKQVIMFPSPTVSLTDLNCRPAADWNIPDLSKSSPSGQWCRLSGLPECSAPYCHGFFGDMPTAETSRIVYNCNLPAGCVSEDIAYRGNYCQTVKDRCSGPWPDEDAEFCQQACKQCSGSCAP